VVPRLGVRALGYGFGRSPYASALGAEAEYSTTTGGFRFTANMDRRFEQTPLHLTAVARVSALEVTSFHGLGNDTPDSAGAFFDVRQRQWMVQPAVAYSLGEWSDLSLGPVLQYSTTDSTPNRLVATTRPYGFGNFTQAGMRIGMHHVASGPPGVSRRQFVLDLTGAWFPAMLDVKRAFTEIEGRAGMVFTVPVPLHPVVLLRGGGKKLFGDFPFHEAAFIGGHSTLRSMAADRYAGDASVYATAELRVPVVAFSLFVPFETGLVGVAETGRVYAAGTTSGGWHAAQGGGIYLGRRDSTPSMMLVVTNEPGRAGPHFRTGLSF
jgi:hypothetical protein